MFKTDFYVRSNIEIRLNVVLNAIKYRFYKHQKSQCTSIPIFKSNLMGYHINAAQRLLIYMYS